MVKCENCRGPHHFQARVCPARKEAQQLAQGWGSPPTHAGSKARAPEAPANTIPSARATDEEGDVEIKGRAEPAADEMKE